MSERSPLLQFEERVILIDELAEMTPVPEAVRFEGFDLTGETIRLVEYARVRRLRPRIRLAARDLSEHGIELLGSETGAVVVIPLDASGEAFDDLAIRGIAQAARLGCTIEIETTLRPSALSALPSLSRFVETCGAHFWSIDFLGEPQRNGGLLRSRQIARVFQILAARISSMKSVVTIREAPSFRRYMKERHSLRGAGADAGFPARVVIPTNRETLVIGSRGETFSCRALPVSVDSVRKSEIAAIWARSPLLSSLRDPHLLRGRCGACELKSSCGGSRARAWRVTGDPLAEDPGCFRAPDRPIRASHIASVRPSA